MFRLFKFCFTSGLNVLLYRGCFFHIYVYIYIISKYVYTEICTYICIRISIEIASIVSTPCIDHTVFSIFCL